MACAVHFNAGGFGDDVRDPSSGGRGSSFKPEMTKEFVVGDDAANADGTRSGTKAAEEVDRRVGFSDDELNDSGNPSVTALELEPLVGRVASALEQHCCVRAGDLVCLCRFHKAHNIKRSLTYIPHPEY